MLGQKYIWEKAFVFCFWMKNTCDVAMIQNMNVHILLYLSSFCGSLQIQNRWYLSPEQNFAWIFPQGFCKYAALGYRPGIANYGNNFIYFSAVILLIFGMLGHIMVFAFLSFYPFYFKTC